MQRAPGKRQIKPSAALIDLEVFGNDEEDDEDFVGTDFNRPLIYFFCELSLKLYEVSNSQSYFELFYQRDPTITDPVVKSISLIQSNKHFT